MRSPVVFCLVLVMQGAGVFSDSRSGARAQVSGDYNQGASAGQRYNDVSSHSDNSELNDFFPSYLKNLENVLQEVFRSNIENQLLALNAAKKAFDITSNEAAIIPTFPFRYPPFNPGFQHFGPPPGVFPPMNFFGPQAPFGAPGFQGFGNFGAGDGYSRPNSAMALGILAPGYKRQMASISPANPLMKNVDVESRFSEPGGGGFKSVSSSSYSSSSNINGREKNERASETVINDNGRITKYSVHS